jgi:hypothetical protein
MTRHIVPNSQVAHLWAHQGQDSARSGNGNISFNGPLLTSYNTYIARIVKDKTGNNVALLSKKTYSPTTSQHLGDARSALGYGENTVMPWFIVDNLGTSYDKDLVQTHLRNINAMLAEFVDECAKHTRARESGDYRVEYLRQKATTIREYADHFDIGMPRLATLDAEIDSAITTQVERLARLNSPAAVAKREKAAKRRAEKVREDYRAARGDYSANASYRDLDRLRNVMTTEDHAARDEAIRLQSAEALQRYVSGERDLRLSFSVTDDEKLQRRVALLPNMADEIAAYRNGGDHYHYYSHDDLNLCLTDDDHAARSAALVLANADKVVAWRAGGNVYLPHMDSALLRVRGNNVETSQGAQFPVAHARLAFPLVKRCHDSGTTWQRNGHRVTLGAFQIDRIDEHGNVRAGCHNVAYDEIELCAQQLGIL